MDPADEKSIRGLITELCEALERDSAAYLNPGPRRNPEPYYNAQVDTLLTELKDQIHVTMSGKVCDCCDNFIEDQTAFQTKLMLIDTVPGGHVDQGNAFLAIFDSIEEWSHKVDERLELIAHMEQELTSICDEYALESKAFQPDIPCRGSDEKVMGLWMDAMSVAREFGARERKDEGNQHKFNVFAKASNCSSRMDSSNNVICAEPVA
jgi:hypothetical protein